VALIPEGLVEFIPEMKKLIGELNDIIAIHEKEFPSEDTFANQIAWLEGKLSAPSMDLIRSLPAEIARELLMDRDPHGNVQVSRIETEKLLIGMVEKRLKALKAAGTYTGKFSALAHFFGYEGRCTFPSNFDADYCYALGFGTFVLIASGLTGYLSSVRNLTAPASQWIAGGIPLTMMMNMEQRHGTKKPVIRKALVELEGAPFKAFAAARDTWAVKTSFLFPGGIQYFGPEEVSDQPTKTLQLEHPPGAAN
jgi:pyrophosphate--fructose-6-phosphate 1-phosphotransferase